MIVGILTALLVLCIIVLIVLVTVFQHGNEGGIGSSLGGGNSAGFFGASGGANIIVRATWITGALLFILATTLAWVKTNQSFGVSREIDKALEALPSASPAASSSSAVEPAPQQTEQSSPTAVAPGNETTLPLSEPAASQAPQSEPQP